MAETEVDPPLQHQRRLPAFVRYLAAALLGAAIAALASYLMRSIGL